MKKKGGNDSGGKKCNFSELNVQARLANSCVKYIYSFFFLFFPSYYKT